MGQQVTSEANRRGHGQSTCAFQKCLDAQRVQRHQPLLLLLQLLCLVHWVNLTAR